MLCNKVRECLKNKAQLKRLLLKPNLNATNISAEQCWYNDIDNRICFEFSSFCLSDALTIDDKKLSNVFLINETFPVASFN